MTKTGWCRVPGFAVRERNPRPRARAQPPCETDRSGVADAGARRGLRKDLRPPPPRHRSPPAAGARRYRHGGDRHAQRHPLPAGAGLRRCRQARGAGEAHVPEHGRGRQHGRRLQGCRRALHVCRGGVFRAEVCADEVAARRRRAWPPDPHQAVGKTRRPPRAPLLGRRSRRRRRACGHGLPRHRLRPLDDGPDADRLGLRPALDPGAW